MKSVRFGVYSRMWFIVMILVTFGLMACGDNNSSFKKTKRDAGNESNNETDSGFVSDTGTNPGNDGGGNGGSDAVNGGNEDVEDSDDDNPCRQTTAEDAAKFAKDYATALCAKMLTCERNSQITMSTVFDGWTNQESCEQVVLARQMSAGQAKAAVNNNTMRLDSCAATKCFVEVNELKCSDAYTAYFENYVPEIHHCYEATAGKVKTGKPCTIDGQCGEREFCQPDEAAGTCGGACEDAGLSLSGQCGDIICRGDQYCDDENRVCLKRQVVGETCEYDHECAYDAECLDSKCVAIVAGLEENAACDSMSALCKIGLICYDEVCTKPVALGGTCEIAGCAGGLFCSDAGKCMERGAKGESCNDDSHCKSMRCASGSCTDPDGLCP